ncbi:DUF4129 domain-containing protein [Mucilaginibacter xinganensis]|uniref:Protein-glutamine gamma-glutamyltransferase-like C-terminal domain-containing protein n=1 Tax=Mucilaginibacter xinganensis TaxID=1234841 RepID=A0A223P2E4_9SPHI|nr:DUF4129 domain-containing protein [Mucilaginibacter xinganensis]ASU36018.1 hypothetical protein MuYL_4133 [Mucilaginibacter xinganensis]
MLRLPVVFCTLFFVLSLWGISFAAPKKIPLKILPDSSKVTVKKFDTKALDKLSADKDFDYKGEGVGKPSLWALFWRWLWDAITRLFNRIPFGGQFLEYLVLGISAAFLVYVIFKSLGIDLSRGWRGDAAKANLSYSESLENIHEINFDADIEKAIAQNNYRLAVRLLYLRCLKQLNDKKLIQWQIDKTNTTYLYELTDPQQKQVFGLLTRQFEYVWYGNFAINKQAFASIDLLFQNFKKQLP